MTRPVLGLLTAVLLAGGSAAQDKPDEVVRKAIDAHGGAAVLKKFTAGTSKLVGIIHAPAGEIGFNGTLAFAVPGKTRLEMSIDAFGQKVELVQVVNGDKARQTENGKAADLTPAVRAELKESAAVHELSQLVPLLDATKYTLTAEPDATVGGVASAVVLVKKAGTKDARLYFDRMTGRLAGMRRAGLNPDGKEVDELTVFSDFKLVEGMTVPMKSAVTHDGKPFLDVTVTEYKPAERLDDKPFTVE